MTIEGNVVKDFQIGNTRIKICDNYCRDTTPEAVQVILDRIANRVQDQLAMQALTTELKLTVDV